MTAFLFRNRVDAGKKLAIALKELKGSDLVILGIPRGGVVVAAEVAKALGAPLDIVITRKIGAPGDPEYGLGAVTQEGEVFMDGQVAESLGVSKEYLDAQIKLKRDEVRERMKKFRGDVPYPDLEGKVVVIVDDGIATGSSVAAAVLSVKKRRPREIVVAVPVAPKETVESLARDGTRVVCLQTPAQFWAIGEFYEVFDQVEDEEVERVLEENGPRET